MRSSVALEEVTVKLPADVAVPPGAVTVIFPLVVPPATTAVICVAVFTTKLDAALPLNATAVAPLKLLPAITTEVPVGPPPGLKLEIAGGAATVKLLEEVAVPSGVVTAMVPVVVPLATVAEMCVSLLTVKLVAALPLKVTAVAPVKLAPVMTTEVPTGPLAGLKLDIVGGGHRKTAGRGGRSTRCGHTDLSAAGTAGNHGRDLSRAVNGETGGCLPAECERGRGGQVRASDGHRGA